MKTSVARRLLINWLVLLAIKCQYKNNKVENIAQFELELPCCILFNPMLYHVIFTVSVKGLFYRGWLHWYSWSLFAQSLESVWLRVFVSHTFCLFKRGIKGLNCAWVGSSVCLCTQYGRSVVVTDGCLLVSLTAWQAPSPLSPSLSLWSLSHSHFHSGWSVFHPSVSLSVCNVAPQRENRKVPVCCLTSSNIFLYRWGAGGQVRKRVHRMDKRLTREFLNLRLRWKQRRKTWMSGCSNDFRWSQMLT